MRTPTVKRALCWCSLLLVGGCCSSVPDETRTVVAERPEPHTAVVQPASALPDYGLTIGDDRPLSMPSDPHVKQAATTAPDPLPLLVPSVRSAPRDSLAPPWSTPAPVQTAPLLVSAQQPVPKERTTDRLKIPADLPGARVPPLELPAPGPAKRKEREEAIRRLFPDLPPLEADPLPKGEPLSLAELQRLAMDNSPLLRQAAADVDAARGVALQAGLWPNPVVGFEGDTMNSGGTAGQLGGFITQTIKTAGKPQLARASALIEVLNAELALRRTEADVVARVRGGYFAVLVARENVKVSRALAEFADEIYRTHVELLKAAQSPAYESLQLRVLSTQARGGLLQARNRYVTAWKQLVSTLGLPEMPPGNLSGDADMPAPQYDHAVVLERVLKSHTDVGTALNAMQKAQIDLKLARVIPVPDVNVYLAVQRDYTIAPNLTTTNVQVGVPIPLWDRNQGAIKAADAALMKAEQESARVHNDLTARVAEAFERYDNNRRLLTYYQTGILPDQVRAYRALYQRYRVDSDPGNFQDVVNAQQLLAQSVTTYLATLSALWTAVVDVSNLLQTDELFGGA